MKHILIVDDEKDIVNLLRLYLEKEDTTVYEAYDGEKAWELMKNQAMDIAIIDIMMPKMNGYELIKKIKAEMDIPLIVISAKGQINEKILGLDLGADDYITKPFEPLEMAARVRARLRSNKKIEESQSVITVGELCLHLDECFLSKNGLKMELTKAEYYLLKLFMEHPGRVFTKEQLYEAGWGDDYVVDDNTIRVLISRLRDKIGAEKIKTIRGLGYRMERHE